MQVNGHLKVNSGDSQRPMLDGHSLILEHSIVNSVTHRDPGLLNVLIVEGAGAGRRDRKYARGEKGNGRGVGWRGGKE
jgi:hypothetical protein